MTFKARYVNVFYHFKMKYWLLSSATTIHSEQKIETALHCNLTDHSSPVINIVFVKHFRLLLTLFYTDRCCNIFAPPYTLKEQFTHK